MWSSWRQERLGNCYCKRSVEVVVCCSPVKVSAQTNTRCQGPKVNATRSEGVKSPNLLREAPDSREAHKHVSFAHLRHVQVVSGRICITEPVSLLDIANESED